MLKYDHPEFQSDIFLILETINAKLVIGECISEFLRIKFKYIIK